jgi:hypothetical protein
VVHGARQSAAVVDRRDRIHLARVRLERAHLLPKIYKQRLESERTHRNAVDV